MDDSVLFIECIKVSSIIRLHLTWSTLTWSTLTTSTILTKYLTSSTLQLTLSLTWSTFNLSTFGLLLIQNNKNFHTFIYIFRHIQTI